MTEQEVNQTIAEAMGLCWHEWKGTYPYRSRQCQKCAMFERDYLDNPSYTSDWAVYGPMLEWAQGEEWWDKFIYEVYDTPRVTFYIMLNPLRGSTALAEFIKENKVKEGR